MHILPRVCAMLLRQGKPEFLRNLAKIERPLVAALTYCVSVYTKLKPSLSENLMRKAQKVENLSKVSTQPQKVFQSRSDSSSLQS